MKVYPINEDQLAQLGTLKGLSGISFTLAGAAIGFAAGIYKDLQIQGSVPSEVLGYWTAIRNVSLGVGIVLGIVGAIFFVWNVVRLSQIKGRTKFET